MAMRGGFIRLRAGAASVRLAERVAEKWWTRRARPLDQLAPLHRPHQRHNTGHERQQVNEAAQRDGSGQSDAPEKQEHDEESPQHVTLRAFEFERLTADCVPRMTTRNRTLFRPHVVKD